MRLPEVKRISVIKIATLANNGQSAKSATGKSRLQCKEIYQVDKAALDARILSVNAGDTSMTIARFWEVGGKEPLANLHGKERHSYSCGRGSLHSRA